MLRNARIRSKVIAILTLPLLGLMVLAAFGIGATVARGRQANQVNDLSRLAVGVTVVVHELEGERTLSSIYVAAQGATPAPSDGMIAQRLVVDQTVRSLRQYVGVLDTSHLRSQLRQKLDQALGALAGLPARRVAIDRPGRALTPEDVERDYNTTISTMLDLNADIAVGSNDEELIRTVTAFVTLSRLKNASDRERAFRLSTFMSGSPEQQQEQFKRFTSLVTLRETWLAQFRNGATPVQRRAYDASVGGSDVALADAIERVILRGDAQDLRRVTSADPVRADRIWYAAMTGRVNQLRKVERDLSANLTATSTAIKAEADRRVGVYAAALAVLLGITAAVSLVIARSMVRPIRQLQAAAEELATHRLPHVVDRLQQARAGGVADDEPSIPIAVRSRDEIGQLAEAFNAVNQVAVRVATEQAALRMSLGEMFLNLARRSQVLTDRSLEQIEGLEQDETDPDALKTLFQLDHLVTRMRRNAENLIVLSGSESPNPWRHPVQLALLLQAAVAEVEEYQRVTLLVTDQIKVAGHSAVDVIHVLAELLENATSFSPPGTPVQITGQWAASGYVLEIEDRGLGMGDEELREANSRLEHAPGIDVALSRRLGLHVVSRLAARHGIKVQLRHSWYGGVTALVMLPATIATLMEAQATGFSTAAGGRANVPATRTAWLPAFEAVSADWSNGAADRPPPLPPPAIAAPATEDAALPSRDATDPGEQATGASDLAMPPELGETTPGPDPPPVASAAGLGRGLLTSLRWAPWLREHSPWHSDDRSPPATGATPGSDQR
jgi:signal transduction histidine kinase